MIKVLNIISDTNIGGAGHVLLNYLKHFDREAFEVSVLMPKNSMLKSPVEATGCRVYEAEGFEDVSFSLPAINIIKKYIRDIQPDIVHTHGSLSGRIAGRQCGKKVVYTRHSAFPVSAKLRKFPGRTVNKLVNEHYADRIIAVSPAAKDNLIDSGISPKKIDVIMNGVEPVERLSGSKLQETRERFKVRDGELVCGILARLEPYKGHQDILHAIRTVKNRGYNVRLIIAGAGSCEKSILESIKTLGLEDCVTFAGFVSDVHSMLSVLDIQLNASTAEATSLSLLEGMSIGLPAIVSDYGGNPYVIESGINGIVFPAQNIEALADAIISLAASDELRKKLSEGAFRIYRERFTADLFARNTEKIYYELMEDKKNGR